jgi:hypothetical protein
VNDKLYLKNSKVPGAYIEIFINAKPLDEDGTPMSKKSMHR